MVPYLNKLYIFFAITGSSGDSVYAYDGLRNRLFSLFNLSDDVPCAVYDPRSNRVFFACHDAPTSRARPGTDSVVRTFDLVGSSYHGKRQSTSTSAGSTTSTSHPTSWLTIDVLRDCVLAAESLPWNIDTLFMDRRLGKLYMCSQDTARVLVFDCNRGAVVDTIDAAYLYAGQLDELNDSST